MSSDKNVLHVVTVSFVINHFFGRQFVYLSKIDNYRFHVACSKSDELFRLSDELNFIPVPVNISRSISILNDVVALFKLYLYIKRNNVSSVFGHTPKAGFLAMLASFLAGCKVRIYFRHGLFFQTSTGLSRIFHTLVEKSSGFLATKVVCVSNDIYNLSISLCLNNPSKSVILSKGTCNGIDVDLRYNKSLIATNKIVALRKELGLDNDSIVVGYVGRLVRDKGIDLLLESWKLLLIKYPNLKLLLVGPFEKRNSISNQSLQFIKESNSIVCTGYVPESYLYYSLMDLFVLPTYREGFSTVALEASSMEIPVLISRVTGCREAIIDNQTGMFIDHSVADIFNKVSMYVDSTELRKKHGLKGRQYVYDNFKQSIIWNEIHHLLIS